MKRKIGKATMASEASKRRWRRNGILKKDPTTCIFCNKRFPSYPQLEIHMNKHTHERPYQCSKCDASYSFYSALFVHTNNIHVGIKYTCQICQKTFTTNTNFSAHKRMHFLTQQVSSQTKEAIQTAAVSMNKITKAILLGKDKGQQESEDDSLAKKVESTPKNVAVQVKDDDTVGSLSAETSNKSKVKVGKRKRTIRGAQDDDNAKVKATKRPRPSLPSKKLTKAVKRTGASTRGKGKKIHPNRSSKKKSPDSQYAHMGESGRGPEEPSAPQSQDVISEDVGGAGQTKKVPETMDQSCVSPEEGAAEDQNRVIMEGPGPAEIAEARHNVTNAPPIGGNNAAPEICFLPPEDPRCAQVERLYALAGISPNRLVYPTNIFFTVNGEITMPILSPQLLQMIGPPPVTSRETQKTSGGRGNKIIPPKAAAYQERKPKKIPPPPTKPSSTAGNNNDNSSALPAMEFPYTCHKCGRGFQYRSKLNGHMITHTGVKAFPCILCPRRFSTKSNLNSHMRTRHNYTATSSAKTTETKGEEEKSEN